MKKSKMKKLLPEVKSIKADDKSFRCMKNKIYGILSIKMALGRSCYSTHTPENH
jgi:hypothetical protein